MQFQLGKLFVFSTCHYSSVSVGCLLLVESNLELFVGKAFHANGSWLMPVPMLMLMVMLMAETLHCIVQLPY